MKFDRIDEYLNSELKKEKTYGMSCCITQGYETVYNKSFGFADRENGKKMQGDELYNFYSMTKPLTCTAALQLFEKGCFLLTDPLHKYIPEFKDMTFKDADGSIKKCSKDILIRDLFTMTAGFDYNLDGEFAKSAREITNGKMDTLSVIKELAKYPLSFETGERWQYSLCHDVLAALVETVSGERFSEYLRKNIFAPLGMNNSGFNPKDFDESRFAVQYRYDGEKTNRTTLDNVHRLGPEYDSGGAGLISCIGDYSKFAMAMANGGAGENGAKILGRRTIELMKRNHLTEKQLSTMNWPELMGCGYGLGVRTLIDPVTGETNAPIGEFGWSGAAGAYLLIDTENKISVVYTQHLLNGCARDIHLPLTNIIYACFD